MELVELQSRAERDKNDNDKDAEFLLNTGMKKRGKTLDNPVHFYVDPTIQVTVWTSYSCSLGNKVIYSPFCAASYHH